MKGGLWLLALGLLALACGPAKRAPSPVATPRSAATTTASGSSEEWRNEVPSPGRTATFAYPAAHVESLDNGLSIYWLPRPGGIVALSLVARGGSIRVEAGDSGLAAFTLRAMTEGTQTKNGLELAEAIESLGTSLDQGAGRDFVRLGLSLLPEDFARGLELLADIARQPRFAPQDISRIRDEWLDSIEAERQDPNQLASRVGLRVLLGERWGAPTDGTRATISTLTRKQLQEFHRSTFTPENLALVVAGDITLEKVREQAARWLGEWPRRAAAPLPRFTAPARRSTPAVHVVDRPGSVQTVVFLAHPLAARTAPGYEARLVFNNAFGGLFTSRLNRNLRERHGYTYGAHSTIATTRLWGAFVIATAVRTEVTAPALEEIFVEMRRVKTMPLSAEEIHRAKADLIQAADAHLEHAEDVTDRTQELFLYSLAADYHARFSGILRALTPEAINGQRAQVNPNEMNVVLVGDLSRFEKALVNLGYAPTVVDESMTL